MIWQFCIFAKVWKHIFCPIVLFLFYLFLFSFAIWMDMSRMWEWDLVVWSPAVTVMLARLPILWTGSGLSMGWVLVCTVAGEYPVVHVCVHRSGGKRYTHGVRWDRRRTLWACVKGATNYGILRYNGARVRFWRGWRGRLGWVQDVVSFTDRDSRAVDRPRCRIIWRYGQGGGCGWANCVRGR